MSRKYFRSIYMNNIVLRLHERRMRAIMWWVFSRRKLSKLARRLDFCFVTSNYLMKYRRTVLYKYRALTNQALAAINLYGFSYNGAWVMRVSLLYNRLLAHYIWLRRRARIRRNMVVSISRCERRVRYAVLLPKKVDDSMVASAYGFITNPTIRRDRCFFRTKTSCYILSWYQGIKFGTFAWFRAKYQYKTIRDRRRRKKLQKDYEKKLKKYEHSVQENMRLLRGKRKKPKKKHIVYYK